MEEIDLKEVFATFWNKKFHIFTVIVVFLILGAVYTFNFVEPKYTSSTTLILASINIGSNVSDDTITDTTSTIEKDITLNSKLVSTYSALIKSKSILREVKSNLDITIDEEDLKKAITVSTVEDTELIEISVTYEDATLACEIANEVANVFKERIKVYYDIENVQIVDVAEHQDSPSNVNHERDIAIFVLVGFVIACGYVVILNMLDTTIKSSEDVEKITNCTVLVELPYFDSIGGKDRRNNKGGKSNAKRAHNV
jgi:capsular polysaccharide biosynthesis protein